MQTAPIDGREFVLQLVPEMGGGVVLASYHDTAMWGPCWTWDGGRTVELAGGVQWAEKPMDPPLPPAGALWRDETRVAVKPEVYRMEPGPVIYRKWDGACWVDISEAEFSELSTSN